MNFVSYKYVNIGTGTTFNDVTTQGDLWKLNKLEMIHHVHNLSTSTIVRKKMSDLITDEVLYMLKKLEVESLEKFINPEDIIRKAGANTLCTFCFGKRYDYDDEEFCKLLEAKEFFGAVVSAGALFDALPWITEPTNVVISMITSNAKGKVTTKHIERVASVCSEIYGAGDRLPTLFDRPNLPYIDAVIHESFRHSSFVPTLIPHTTLDDTTLHGYHIPQGTMVFVNQYSVNRDPNVWPDPEKFDPMRFLCKDESGNLIIDNVAVGKYLIFSIGLRKCPGSKSAKTWLFSATAILAQRSELIPDPSYSTSLDAEPGLALRPSYLRIKLRLNT
ncbi:unnamed protein product [Clavelina lepadiformis]|uniref:Cytochrome P450 n=1 Tax=Clavelina lepadiformis TaxID=159417 RepID=A0ABP0GJ80_CLALP